MTTQVSNIRLGQRFDIFVGRKARGMHYGNPFTHLHYGRGIIKVSTRDEACDAFDQWLDGLAYQEVEPERRQWILDNLHDLKDLVLGCYCFPERCHAMSLARRADQSAQIAS